MLQKSGFVRFYHKRTKPGRSQVNDTDPAGVARAGDGGAPLTMTYLRYQRPLITSLTLVRRPFDDTRPSRARLNDDIHHLPPPAATFKSAKIGNMKYELHMPFGGARLMTPLNLRGDRMLMTRS
ncbi:hypothetical protein EVAR_19731_1 [Eumeta japonica]|uniref:Uncharacterized protein n=1 Tax=Eumeta variegata TaxID=151549 RepID=A0A4C1UR50_EUMVA|nr:hypothetical protein EVAR_19731_1 [Eumeta japonica]